ncbi:MAG: L,D-transpeptidase [Thermoleophilia bacterium]|nr:L,D-transpeptidase [Thermoleophilia bacterium]
MTARSRRAALAVSLCALALAAPPALGQATAPAYGPEVPTASRTWVGRLVASVVVRSQPRDGAPRVMTVGPIAPLGKGITTLSIIDRRRDVTGRMWAKVLLPRRPNGSAGWLPADQMRLLATPIRVRIDLSERRLYVFRAGRLLRRYPVAVGALDTPTPTGRFAVAEMIRTNHPGAFLGPLVFPLTGFSRVLNEYAGGNGRVAIHGTSLPELIGTRASHGCIRMRNADVVALSRLLRPGAPVRIVP